MEHADDLAAILDHLAIARVPVYGGSGAAPHVLAFAARHPHRVAACTVVDGGAPLTDDEVLQQVDFNMAGDSLARAGNVDALRALLEEARASILADPIAGFRALMDTAPAEDLEIMGRFSPLGGRSRSIKKLSGGATNRHPALRSRPAASLAAEPDNNAAIRYRVSKEVAGTSRRLRRGKHGQVRPPDPRLALDRVQALASAERIKTLPIKLLCTGHGAPVHM